MSIIDDLIRDEGIELKPYRCTSGKLTIGVGRNLDENGITTEEARILLENDLRRFRNELNLHCGWWRGMVPRRQEALLNMCFNMGWPRLSTFKKFLAALEVNDFDLAAHEALDSRWAQQVGDRAIRIAEQIREG